MAMFSGQRSCPERAGVPPAAAVPVRCRPSGMTGTCWMACSYNTRPLASPLGLRPRAPCPVWARPHPAHPRTGSAAARAVPSAEPAVCQATCGR